MAKHTPKIVFGLTYAVTSFGVTALLSGASAGPTDAALQQVVPILTAPLALLVALRLGALSKVGVAAASLAVELACYVAIWAIYHSLAVPVGGSVPFFAPAQQGGWLLAFNSVLFVLSPVVWLHFVGSQSRQPQSPNAAA
ncbi:hypothetical protein QFW77_03055 [Luteimonas sp. RD2P54]|uniref:Uncharacterized protein n=1 Tax=Luteimonas endophytica TaxID=3042023 RepID=A0ABT6J573_9GAMM|nr:hypothetical protein [Luteimonas endophytica]MDH5821972.1 hypothetical protein [Luteimonas endophytica]